MWNQIFFLLSTPTDGHISTDRSSIPLTPKRAAKVVMVVEILEAKTSKQELVEENKALKNEFERLQTHVAKMEKRVEELERNICRQAHCRWKDKNDADAVTFYTGFPNYEMFEAFVSLVRMVRIYFTCICQIAWG